jgi:hypothetical protein
VFEYIEIFYNRTRRHSAIGYISPEQFDPPPFSRTSSQANTAGRGEP